MPLIHHAAGLRIKNAQGLFSSIYGKKQET